MEHPYLVAFEKRLKDLFDRVDDYLEERYEGLYPLHPVRPPRGATSSKDQDGLFSIGASFSPGFGTRYGKGYVVDLRIATLSHVDPSLKETILHDALSYLQKLLDETFPDRHFRVVKDGEVYKIVGDLSLREDT
ncbi:hypothetical protein Spith_1769 [Spirochaeta thermophila DSM 6578]|uniref:Uncharacterized protein n=1 Tax=Winmispira thermophila (strain ATCC 700085 / DSM 6578 / Z-1203) TaxID=869211 RepID=G0GCG2_WINT7|nr:hypothetical protein [Spirochaeta thermophila]AEJ62028.1 hypothetical protein Spith_1769 [Spirochaeta thermophila DSM 6578]